MRSRLVAQPRWRSQKRGPRGPRPSRIPPEIEAQTIEYSLAFATRAQARVANDLSMKSLNLGPGSLRSVWQSLDLATQHRRLLRLEAVAEDQTLMPFEEQVTT